MTLSPSGIITFPIAGWRRDENPDPRDWLMAAPAPKFVLPSASMLDWSGVPILDQGRTNGCVGWSLAIKVRYLDWLFDKAPVDYSPLYIYDRAREIGGIPIDDDNGAYIRDGFKALKKWGIPELSKWPTSHGTYITPDAAADEAAEKHQALFYYRCVSSRTIKASIAAGFPVQIGFDCPKDLFSFATQGTGEVYFPDDGKSFEGRHAITLIGYDDNKTVGADKGTFYFANSWTRSWGLKGIGLLPQKFVDTGHAADAWSLRAVEL